MSPGHEHDPGSGVGGSLTVVGTGIRPPFHTSTETIRCIERAGKVLYLFAEDVPAKWIERLNPTAASLRHHYLEHERRTDVYEAMVEELLSWVRKDTAVCAAFYGHPGVFVGPSHDAVRVARDEGYPARMLPAISAEDCLFADLGVDPGEAGCQSFEATDFLVRELAVDPSVPLVLWQISVIGDEGTGAETNRSGLRVLAERLAESYGADHEAVLYEASPFPVGGPLVERVPLGDLPEAEVTALATLYVPPGKPPRPSPRMFDRLGISRQPADA